MTVAVGGCNSAFHSRGGGCEPRLGRQGLAQFWSWRSGHHSNPLAVEVLGGQIEALIHLGELDGVVGRARAVLIVPDVPIAALVDDDLLGRRGLLADLELCVIDQTRARRR